MVGTRLTRTAAARAGNPPSDTEAEDARADAPDLIWSAAGFRVSRRRRTAARKRPEAVQTVAAPPSAAAETGRQPGPRFSMLDLNVPALDPEQAVDGLRFLLQKELSHSDASSLGRIVLPKREAEVHLPVLTARNGIEINMDDLETFQVWTFKYRYWPNNKSRMYILDNTANFIAAHGLQIGDLIMIYKDDERDRLVIRAKKAAKEQAAASADDGIFDSIVPDIVVASARYSDLYYPLLDAMSMAYGVSNVYGDGLNYAFAADFTMGFSEERMGNPSNAESLPRFGWNLSLDDLW
ncbi:B3 domain-containing protein LFL1-like [Phoenix dactylifera]|uniref:B3 domain-containing protein LFL1-like n=1 Tax=Phoenix dactylifera TaxID=42345 RepID=A0A8B7CZI0_PHODC|nr:B3 domain-containing protein LFL1-like [Phoenix dactylifera]